MLPGASVARHQTTGLGARSSGPTANRRPTSRGLGPSWGHPAHPPWAPVLAWGMRKAREPSCANTTRLLSAPAPWLSTRPTCLEGPVPPVGAGPRPCDATLISGHYPRVRMTHAEGPTRVITRVGSQSPVTARMFCSSCREQWRENDQDPPWAQTPSCLLGRFSHAVCRSTHGAAWGWDPRGGACARAL